MTCDNPKCILNSMEKEVEPVVSGSRIMYYKSKEYVLYGKKIRLCEACLNAVIMTTEI